MKQLEFTILRRWVELLLMVPLWKCFNAADCCETAWRMFCAQSELGQIGTITCLLIIVRAIRITIHEIWQSIDQLWRKSRSVRWGIPIPAGDPLSQAQASLREQID